jgi:hypothetical protein
MLFFAPGPSTSTRRDTVRVPVVRGRLELKATRAFHTYWRFAGERQEMFFRNLHGHQTLTGDPILSSYRFTNAYRASDRVSQFLLSHVIPGSTDEIDTVFRTLLFKIFNRIDTWRYLVNRLGSLHYSNFSTKQYDAVLSEAISSGSRIYSAAYIMPSPQFGLQRKHSNHLALLKFMMDDQLPRRLQHCTSLRQAYELLLSYRSLGPFLAFQFVTDLNYSPILDFEERDFVVAGPGAVDGIRKCFVETAGLSNEDVIKAMADMAHEQFSALGIKFLDLWGRPLQLIDCQNLFCEVDKYCRVAHPELSGTSGRTRIKQRYVPNGEPMRRLYPEKWRLNTSLERRPTPAVIGAA